MGIACSYRDNYEKFKELDVAVYGLSTDKPNANKSFQNNQKLPYTLICDPEKKLLKPLGASLEGKVILRFDLI